ncbi:hypothetical protein [Nocardioides antri]|uniref:Uncharacterized protein n=1 Tax=Nocardioides antri TaxID=2607659 RepID=A0A5B1M165_9ACTN|nr:hypothetical protein [Nocardioides antri]KAA1426662.1 hypothetical protein F0U47_13025 [Nocardioides antri]
MTSTPTTIDRAPQRRAHRDDAPPVCWCGQILDYANPGHCRRCGAASVTHSRLVPLSHAG